MFFDVDNGIANKGNSTTSYEVLGKMQKDTNLHPLLREMILTPNNDNYLKFKEWWRGVSPRRNPVLTNRVFAGLLPKQLSSTVDESKFNDVVNFLKENCGLTITLKGNWFEKNTELANWLNTQIKDELESESDLDKNIWRNIFVWELFVYSPSRFNIKKQFIKYGAPGTGKTFSAKQNVQNHFNIWRNRFNPSYSTSWENQVVTVQFHPSFTYEDFVEGIKPVLNDNNETQLKLKNGVFKDFCKQAGKWEIEALKIISGKDSLKEKKWEDITVGDIKSELSNNTIWDSIKETDNNALLSEVIPPFYFIIDEINRAELSRVLGELMYCLEYRGIEGKIQTQYSTLVEKNSDEMFWFENGNNFFFIPHNVYIIGTMNTIDRSVESFDFALRRRFQWEEVVPDFSLVSRDGLPEKFRPFIESITALNDEIKKNPLLGKDFCIGHAYFMNRPKFVDEKSLKDFKAFYWKENIKPLLEEYLRGSGEPETLRKFKSIFLS